MKKLLKWFLFIWICVTLVLFTGIGIFMKLQLGKALETPVVKEKYLTAQSVYTGEAKLDDRLIAICLNAVMSDWVYEAIVKNILAEHGYKLVIKGNGDEFKVQIAF